MPGDKDDHELPIDPNDWERTELYKGDDAEIQNAIHEAKTEIFDESPAPEGSETGVTRAPSRRSGWTLLLIALVVGGSAAAVTVLIGRGGEVPSAGPGHGPESRAVARPADAAPAAAVTPDRAALDAAPTAPPSPDAAPEPIPADFTEAFRRQQPAVTGCLAEHAADAAGLERITLRFDLKVDGTVKAAAVTPKRVASTGLGRCLLAVAKRARFAPQPQPVGIRIPIALRRK